MLQLLFKKPHPEEPLCSPNTIIIPIQLQTEALWRQRHIFTVPAPFAPEAAPPGSDGSVGCSGWRRLTATAQRLEMTHGDGAAARTAAAAPPGDNSLSPTSSSSSGVRRREANGRSRREIWEKFQPAREKRREKRRGREKRENRE
ncbi:uncharacterized protein LOC121809033 [Salvia splendens]|uniref:uncharacterized protein LOC121809033 n=1 Tax=Salvia splendens TaxID=180675 RepID=UPI001C26654E|nr:uncharacterized protein LOC121809033 [Salvia splendens]